MPKTQESTKMPETPPTVTSLEALGVHVWHLQQLVTEGHRTLKSVATHDDIRAIHVTLASLATRTEMEARIKYVTDEMARENRAVREEYERRFTDIRDEHRRALSNLQDQFEAQKLSKVFKNLVMVVTGLLAIGALLAGLHGVSLWFGSR